LSSLNKAISEINNNEMLVVNEMGAYLEYKANLYKVSVRWSQIHARIQVCFYNPLPILKRWSALQIYINIVTCRVVYATKMTDSSLDNWIY
jgi:hypothetical protein